MFDNIKDAMTFTKGERTAIIILAAVILLIIAANFFIANMPSNVNENLHNLDSIIALHEKAVSYQQSFISYQQSAVSREKPSTSKVQQPTANSQQPTAKVQKNSPSPSPLPIALVNINTADTTGLISLPGIGSYFARNIVSYREKLGGFIDISQLLEIYAFDTTRLEKIKSHIIIDSI